MKLTAANIQQLAKGYGVIKAAAAAQKPQPKPDAKFEFTPGKSRKIDPRDPRFKIKRSV